MTPIALENLFFLYCTMPINENLANRVREIIADTGEERVDERKMFGGLCFMVDEKICVGVKADRMLVRLAPELFEEALEKDGVIPMSSSGMNGFVYVMEDVLHHPDDLKYWVKLALDFNPFAKASKK